MISVNQSESTRAIARSVGTWYVRRGYGTPKRDTETGLYCPTGLSSRFVPIHETDCEQFGLCSDRRGYRGYFSIQIIAKWPIFLFRNCSRNLAHCVALTFCTTVRDDRQVFLITFQYTIFGLDFSPVWGRLNFILRRGDVGFWKGRRCTRSKASIQRGAARWWEQLLIVSNFSTF